jgi:prophage regulatory protein
MSVPDRIIRDKECQHITGLTASARDREIRAGRFPAPIKLSPAENARAVGWSLRAVQAWVDSRIASQEAAA